MEVRYGVSPREAKGYDTEKLRENFLMDSLFITGETKFIYSHIDRIIVGSACPIELLKLEGGKEIGSAYFLERRELGIINIGETGFVIADGERIELNPRDGLYIGKGIKEVVFESADKSRPAKFYLNSAPAHKAYPIVKIHIEKANPNDLGSIEQSK
ncbi:5-deoxy-glucuronate isomerase [Crassaminicella profunda]|uniref:5-deoxy-glucuronate isomerase n=1 Tax=Crassaminicella profunda TaxID=1286698 RepID=UPI001FE5CEE2|nr:5-deoxy-glucuronate isomerase [Crassaminicella profunda]